MIAAHLLLALFCNKNILHYSSVTNGLFLLWAGEPRFGSSIAMPPVGLFRKQRFQLKREIMEQGVGAFTPVLD